MSDKLIDILNKPAEGKHKKGAKPAPRPERFAWVETTGLTVTPPKKLK